MKVPYVTNTLLFIRSMLNFTMRAAVAGSYSNQAGYIAFLTFIICRRPKLNKITDERKDRFFSQN